MGRQVNVLVIWCHVFRVGRLVKSGHWAKNYDVSKGCICASPESSPWPTFQTYITHNLAICIARGRVPIWEIMFSSRLADAFCLLRFVAQLPGALQCTLCDVRTVQRMGTRHDKAKPPTWCQREKTPLSTDWLNYCNVHYKQVDLWLYEN